MFLNRRQTLAGLAALSSLPSYVHSAGAQTERGFSPLDAEREAEALSRQPYVGHGYRPPAPLDGFGYDEYRDIRFRKDRAIWREDADGLSLQMFLASFIYHDPVEILLVDKGIATPLAPARGLFDFGLSEPRVPAQGDFRFSGFRVHGPINSSQVNDEILAFNGASYFRALGRGLSYGLSARGLALNTHGGPTPEEFPRFVKFWIERPPGTASMRIHALLDSPSVTGAYQFVLLPGSPTFTDISAVLFPRMPLDRVGLAPLTSMFLFDSRNQRGFHDYRPAVHDSDGLAIAMPNGQHIWRPLLNPATVQASAFLGDSPAGFGLIQRKRRYEQYLDLEANYEHRPSAWITPGAGWPRGHVELVELPIAAEWFDNIVCYWKLAEPLAAGQPFRFSYRLAWTDTLPGNVRRVRETRIGTESGQTLFVVDFEPFEGDRAINAARVSTTSGSASRPIVLQNRHTGGVRCFFKLAAQPGTVCDLTLDAGSAASEAEDAAFTAAANTERWIYRWTG